MRNFVLIPDCEIGRPIIESLANDFCELSGEVLSPASASYQQQCADMVQMFVGVGSGIAHYAHGGGQSGHRRELQRRELQRRSGGHNRQAVTVTHVESTYPNPGLARAGHARMQMEQCMTAGVFSDTPGHACHAAERSAHHGRGGRRVLAEVETMPEVRTALAKTQARVEQLEADLAASRWVFCYATIMLHHFHPYNHVCFRLLFIVTETSPRLVSKARERAAPQEEPGHVGHDALALSPVMPSTDPGPGGNSTAGRAQ